MSVSFLLLKPLVHTLFSHFPKHKDTLKENQTEEKAGTNKELLCQAFSYFLHQQVRNKGKKKEKSILLSLGEVLLFIILI